MRKNKKTQNAQRFGFVQGFPQKDHLKSNPAITINFLLTNSLHKR